MEGIKKLLGAQTAGLPNWAWLLIIGGGIAIAIVAPKVFKGFGAGSSDTTTDTGASPPTTDMSGYTPYTGGYGGGGGTTGDGGGGIPVTTPTPTDTTQTGTTTQPTVFPPVQPSAPAPPPSTAPTDQCKQRQGCIDYHIGHDCSHLKDAKKKQECEQHWILKCNQEHPCGHSLVPAVEADASVWPNVRQERRKNRGLTDNS